MSRDLGLARGYRHTQMIQAAIIITIMATADTGTMMIARFRTSMNQSVKIKGYQPVPVKPFCSHTCVHHVPTLWNYIILPCIRILIFVP